MIPTDLCQCGNIKKKMAKLCIPCRNIQTKIDIKWRLENKKEMMSATSKEKYKLHSKQLKCRRCDLTFKHEEIDGGVCHTCKAMKGSNKMQANRKYLAKKKEEKRQYISSI